jgi:alanine racemase
MTRPARALIDYQALRHNLHRVREAAPGRRVVAVIKANAYGHGLVKVARALADADAYAVARLDEGLQLREAGIASPVLLLSGVEALEDLRTARSHRLDLVAHSEYQIGMLEEAPSGPRVRVWLKMDSGMHRLGLAPQSLAPSYARLTRCRSSVGQIVLMTHLADADQPGSETTARQLALFEECAADIDAEHSIANSGGLLGWEAARADWVRPGIMLYGISPFAAGTAADHGLRPVMTLETRLIAVNQAHPGERIGYGGTYTCAESMPVGVAAIGYGDGYPRHVVSGTPVLVDGVRCPLAGRVSMDLITIDLRPYPDARPGSRVVLWGQGLPVEEVAGHAGTIPYELVCRIARRVDFVDGSE